MGERERKKPKEKWTNAHLHVAVGYDGHHNILVYTLKQHLTCYLLYFVYMAHAIHSRTVQRVKDTQTEKHIHFCNKTSSDGHIHTLWITMRITPFSKLECKLLERWDKRWLVNCISRTRTLLWTPTLYVCGGLWHFSFFHFRSLSFFHLLQTRGYCLRA